MALASESKLEFQLDRSLRASEGIYRHLRERIIGLELAPGSSFSRGQIAKEYGVSPMPVRDALARLEVEGLVEIYPQSRTLVARIDVHHAQVTQYLRTSVETRLVQDLANAPQAGLFVALEGGLAAQKEALASGDLLRFSALDRDFHRLMYAVGGIEDIWALIVGRSGHIDRLRRINLPIAGRAATFLADHEAILTAIKAGDGAGARAAVEQHLAKTLDSIARARDQHPTFF